MLQKNIKKLQNLSERQMFSNINAVDCKSFDFEATILHQNSTLGFQKPFLKLKRWCNCVSQPIMSLKNDVKSLRTYKLHPQSKHKINTYSSCLNLSRLIYTFRLLIVSFSPFNFELHPFLFLTEYFLMIFIGSVIFFQILFSVMITNQCNKKFPK